MSVFSRCVHAIVYTTCQCRIFKIVISNRLLLLMLEYAMDMLSAKPTEMWYGIKLLCVHDYLGSAFIWQSTLAGRIWDLLHYLQLWRVFTQISAEYTWMYLWQLHWYRYWILVCSIHWLNKINLIPPSGHLNGMVYFIIRCVCVCRVSVSCWEYSLLRGWQNKVQQKLLYRLPIWQFSFIFACRGQHFFTKEL